MKKALNFSLALAIAVLAFTGVVQAGEKNGSILGKGPILVDPRPRNMFLYVVENGKVAIYHGKGGSDADAIQGALDACGKDGVQEAKCKEGKLDDVTNTFEGVLK